MGLDDNVFYWLNSWSSTAGVLLIFLILWLFLWWDKIYLYIASKLALHKTCMIYALIWYKTHMYFITWLVYYLNSLRLTRREVDDAERRTGIPAAGGTLPLLGHLPQVFKLVGWKSEFTIYEYNCFKKKTEYTCIRNTIAVLCGVM